MIRWFVRLSLVVLGAGLLATGVFVAWERSWQQELDVTLDQLADYTPPTTVQVLDDRGQPLDSFGVERREWVDLEGISPWMIRAVMAAEDRRFLEHSGVDPLGIARAMVRNVQAGTITEGGSTLTQQLVKGLVVGSERSYERKIREALLARRLEARWSKDELLELYLNHAYFGSGNYGVQAASRDYFGLEAHELGPAEAALLAGVVPAPSAYSPRTDVDEAKAQRDRVLGDLAETGDLTPERALELQATPIRPPARTHRGTALVGDAYRTAVRREIREVFTRDGAHARGLTLRTPYDAEVQEVAEKAVQDAVDALYQRQGHIEVGYTEDVRGFLDAAEGLKRSVQGAPLLPTVGDCFPAVVRRPWQDLAVGPYRVGLRSGEWTRRVRSGSARRSGRTLASHGWGTTVDLCMTPTGAVVQTSDWADGAAVVIDNETSGVVALVGGTSMELEGFNHATQARRQPGSTFKPYVYGAALANGWTQLDKVLDAPIRVGRWRPRNAGGYHGRIPMRSALTYSLNTAAVRLALETGVSEVVSFARSVGVRSPIRRDLTIALGSSEVTVLDQATGFATLARSGRNTEPVFLAEVRDVHGQWVGGPGSVVSFDGSRVRLPGPDASQAIPATVATQLRDMLGEVVRRGTGRRAYDPERPRAGKTGTTSDYVDAWFVGFTPSHTVAVWVGALDRESMGRGEYGGRTALPAWITIVESIEDGSEFPMPVASRPVRHGGRVAWIPRTARFDADDELPAFPTARP